MYNLSQRVQSVSSTSKSFQSHKSSSSQICDSLLNEIKYEIEENDKYLNSSPSTQSVNSSNSSYSSYTSNVSTFSLNSSYCSSKSSSSEIFDNLLSQIKYHIDDNHKYTNFNECNKEKIKLKKKKINMISNNKSFSEIKYINNVKNDLLNKLKLQLIIDEKNKLSLKQIEKHNKLLINHINILR